MKKTILIGLGIFAILLLAVGVVYLVRKPSVRKPSPTPAPQVTQSPEASPVKPQVLEVNPGTSVCKSTFVVACASNAPSPSPSPSTPPSAQLDCVAKEVYADDSRNRAGFYYLENKIADEWRYW